MKIIELALNGCPLSSLGPYGNEWIATPNLDRFASESVVFDAHYSDCPDPSVAREVWRKGSANPSQSSNSDDLPTRLNVRGIPTFLIRHTRVANDAHAEFYAGWSELFDARPDPADPSPADSLLRILPGVLERLAPHPEWLLWIDIDRLLPPWDAPQHVFDVYMEDLIEPEKPKRPDEDADEDNEDEDEDEDEEEEEMDEVIEEEIEAEIEEEDSTRVSPWTDPEIGWFDQADLASWELLHRSMAAAMTVFDADLGRLFDLMRERGLDRSATCMFTADRGLPLGEHGIIGSFRPWLHEELVHVPLIVRLPEFGHAGNRVAEFTQPADLHETLRKWFELDRAEIPSPGEDKAEKADSNGDLTPLLHGQRLAIRDRVFSHLKMGDSQESSVRTKDWCLILPLSGERDDEPREIMMFEKPDDRWEVNNLSTRYPEIAEELAEALRAKSR